MKNNIPLQPSQIYHLYTHANGAENLFRSDDNYLYFLRKYAEYIYPVAETYAYCLMPNHLHLMVRIRELPTHQLKNLQGFENLGGLVTPKLVSQQFSNLFNAYTKAYNKMYERKGSLFIPNFKRKIVEDEEYFTRLIIYIHNNPVGHGFVTDPADWTYSSYQSFITDKPTKLEKDKVLHWFSDENQYLEVHQKHLYDQFEYFTFN